MTDIQNLLTLPDIATLLAELHKTDKSIVPLKASTLRYYVITGKSSRKPHLPTILKSGVRFANRADVMAWIEAYKNAPKLGRRGNGSKQPLRASKAQKLRGKHS